MRLLQHGTKKSTETHESDATIGIPRRYCHFVIARRLLALSEPTTTTTTTKRKEKMMMTTTTTRRTTFFNGVKMMTLCVMMMMSCARGQEMPTSATWDSNAAASPMPAPMPAPAPAPGTDAGMMRTVVDVAIEDARFATLVTAVVAAPDVLETLEQPGPWTVFAPTNDAIVTFLTENGLTAEQLLASPALPDILKKHVVAGTLLSSDAVAAVSQGPITLTTLGGVEIDARIVDGALYVGGAQVIQTDIMADNGVIHVIDRVVA